jgi:hypothetical protein
MHILIVEPWQVYNKRKQRDSLMQILKITSIITTLKGLSHEIEMSYTWYKLIEPNYKLNLL